MATATKVTKETQRKLERNIARQAYIETAKVTLLSRKHLAIVTSEFDTDREYCVEVLNGKAASCGCEDFYWKSKRDPEHQCKHMSAANRAIEAAKPAKKVRRSAPREDVIAQLQVKEGTKVGIAAVRKAMAKCPQNAHNVDSMSSTCPEVVSDKAA